MVAFSLKALLLGDGSVFTGKPPVATFRCPKCGTLTKIEVVFDLVPPKCPSDGESMVAISVQVGCFPDS